MHGHVHLFEALSFASAHPVSLVMGNSGSLNEGWAPTTPLPAGTQAYPGAVIDDYASQSEYGFAMLERIDTPAGSDWQLTEYTALGKASIRCRIHAAKSRCEKLN
jgi:hypothetical protein